RRLGAKARRECQTVLRLLERGEIFLERRSGRVAAARVLEAQVLTHALLREGGGQVDRLHDCARRRVWPLAHVDGAGGEAPPIPGFLLRQISAARDARQTRAGRSA